jgi:hypothetical protein
VSTLLSSLCRNPTYGVCCVFSWELDFPKYDGATGVPGEGWSEESLLSGSSTTVSVMSAPFRVLFGGGICGIFAQEKGDRPDTGGWH